MILVAGAHYSDIVNTAIDSELKLSGSTSLRGAAFGLMLPEYLIDDYRAIDDLSRWRWPIPDNSYDLLLDGMRFCTPEFTFLLLARLLPPEELALFGLELCGTYAIDKNDPRGFVSDTKPESTVKEMEQFLDACPGAPGSKTARMALRWVANKSASPMESMLTLLLCLPRRIGGFGLPMPELNVKASEILKREIEGYDPPADLVWRDDKFTLEFESELEHAGRERLDIDYKRSAFFEDLGIHTISVAPGQVNDTIELERIVRLTSRAIGKKHHPSDRELRRRNAALRDRLYDFTRIECSEGHANWSY